MSTPDPRIACAQRTEQQIRAIVRDELRAAFPPLLVDLTKGVDDFQHGGSQPGDGLVEFLRSLDRVGGHEVDELAAVGHVGRNLEPADVGSPLGVVDGHGDSPLLDANHRSVGSTDADAGSNGEVSM